MEKNSEAAVRADGTIVVELTPEEQQLFGMPWLHCMKSLATLSGHDRCH